MFRLRRLTLDLTGFPPTTAELDAFLTDPAADAYDRAVTRLLGSARFGEHFARQWLDAVRYADTHGRHLDNERTIWPYRDWVVRAFNENLPFDQFTVQQLAGDLLPRPSVNQLVASGYNRCHLSTSEGGSIEAEADGRNTADRAETTAAVWLGLTANCASCHDHKFDPLSQREYYAFGAFFKGLADRVWDGNVRQPGRAFCWRMPNSGSGLDLIAAELPSRQAAVTARADAIEATQGAPEKRTKQPITYEVIWAEDADVPTAENFSQPPAAGEWRTGPDVPVAGGERALRLEGRQTRPFTFATGELSLTVRTQAAAFVHVCPDPRNPPLALTSPSALDDPLLVKDAWVRLSGGNDQAMRTVPLPLDIKYLIGLAGATQQNAEEKARMTTFYRDYIYGPLRGELESVAFPARRLMAEQVHHELTIPGSPISRELAEPRPAHVLVRGGSNTKNYVQDHGAALYRRSLYTFWKRTAPPPSMAMFDAPSRETLCVGRGRSNTPLQALVLMNDVQFFEAARAFAERVLREDRSDGERLVQAFRAVTARVPTVEERTWLREALATHRAHFAADEAAAKKVVANGESKPSTALPAGEFAAWTLVANLLFNLDDVDLPESIRAGQRITTMASGQTRFPVAPSLFKFAQYGQNGTWVSELLPWNARLVDDITIVRSVHTNAINHDPACTFLMTGSEIPGKASLGSWLSYGLGSVNNDLPAFVVLTPRCSIRWPNSTMRRMPVTAIPRPSPELPSMKWPSGCKPASRISPTLQCKDVDQACFGLITDLKQRGLLEDTLVICAGEFGRTVYSQGSLTATKYGRDHHPRCFSVWLAGGGIKRGFVYGETDDFSYNIVGDPVSLYDLNAPLLHCLGIDHAKFSFKFQGLDQRLTGVEPAKVVKAMLA